MDITIWYLSTCSTCTRILKELGLDGSRADLIDIKKHPVTPHQVEDMKRSTGSYKLLINGRSTQFRQMDKKARDLSEQEAKELLLQHYAFLKRPVIRIDDQYFVGNAKSTISEVKNKLSND